MARCSSPLGVIGIGDGVLRASLLGVPLAFLAAAYLLPIAGLLTFGSGVATYVEVVSNGFYLKILAGTLTFAVKVTLLSLAIGYPIAAFARTASPSAGRLVIFCATLPLWTSLLARTYAWLMILNRHGPINELLTSLHLVKAPLDLLHTSFAAIVGSVYVTLPLMVLSLYTPMREIDLSVVRAARTLGASPMQSFLRAFLPLSLPGIVSGCMLAFILSLGFFVTPALLGGAADRTFSMLIAQQIGNLGTFEAAASLSMVLLVATLIFLFLFGFIVGFEQFTGGPVGVHVPLSSGYGAKIAQLLAPIEQFVRFIEWRGTWRLLVGLVLLLLALPYLTLIPMSLSSAEYLQFPPWSLSFRWYAALAGDRQWVSSGMNSIVVGAIATIIAVVAGVMAAMGLRGLRGRTGRLLVTTSILPAIIRTMIYSIGLYYSAVQVGLTETSFGLAVAHAALGFPFVVIICGTALSAINPSIEQAAQSLGAQRFARFRRVVLPLIAPSLFAGGLITFQTSFDEIVVALFMSGVNTRTLPKQMWQSATLEVTPIVAAVAVVVLLLILLADSPKL